MFIKSLTFSLKKKHLKVSSAKWRPFCLGPNVSTEQQCWPITHEIARLEVLGTCLNEEISLDIINMFFAIFSNEMDQQRAIHFHLCDLQVVPRAVQCVHHVFTGGDASGIKKKYIYNSEYDTYLFITKNQLSCFLRFDLLKVMLWTQGMMIKFFIQRYMYHNAIYKSCV